MLNYALLSHPVNWLVVVLIGIFVFYALYVIRRNAGQLLPSIPSW